MHPLYPELIAVGGSDPFVRLYDRRMISKTGDVNSGESSSSSSKSDSCGDSKKAVGCVGYYAPGHIPIRTGRGKPQKHRNYVTTHVTFSPDGQELLQNLGGEHIYLYNLKENRKPLEFSVNDTLHSCSNGKRNGFCHNIEEKNGYTTTKNGLANGLNSTYAFRKEKSDSYTPIPESEPTNELPETALQLKLKGNEAFQQQNYFQAIICYSNAIQMVPGSSVLYANRAAALLKRCW